MNLSTKKNVGDKGNWDSFPKIRKPMIIGGKTSENLFGFLFVEKFG